MVGRTNVRATGTCSLATETTKALLAIGTWRLAFLLLIQHAEAIYCNIQPGVEAIAGGRPGIAVSQAAAFPISSASGAPIVAVFLHISDIGIQPLAKGPFFSFNIPVNVASSNGDLVPRGVGGGNLLVADDGRLLIATPTELIAMRRFGVPPKSNGGDLAKEIDRGSSTLAGRQRPPEFVPGAVSPRLLHLSTAERKP